MGKMKLRPAKPTVDQQIEQWLADNPEAAKRIEDYYKKKIEREAAPEFPHDTNCPFCGARTAWNRRSISGKQARGLISLYNKTKPGEYAHLNEFASQLGDGDEIAKMKFYGLVVAMPNTDDPTKTHSGMWCLTDLGRRFVEGTATVQKYVWIYRSKLKRREGPQIKLSDCLGKKFDIRETGKGRFEVKERESH